MWGQNVEKFPETLMCPNLKTLFVESCHKLKKFSSGFFQFMPLIRVLSLACNDNLSELPTGIGELNGLRYLNLAATRIRELPIELKNLKNLMILRLDSMQSPITIPQDLISNLISLKLFNIWNTNILSGVEILLEELESLNDINEIGITISCALSLNKLKRSHKLQRCISHLQLHKWGDGITLELSSLFLKRMEHLNDLEVDHCDDVKVSMEREMKQNDVIGLSNYNVAREQYIYSLRYIGIKNCSKLVDLTWVVYASCLEELHVEDCESIELVLHHDHGAYEIVEKLDIFSRLKCLKLNRLPRLKSIYQHPLLFPSLEIIKVYDCKSLRSLPFDSNTSNNNLKKIKGETNWWNRLRWKDETIKDSFTPYFQVDKAEAYFAEESETSSIDDDMQEQLVSN